MNRGDPCPKCGRSGLKQLAGDPDVVICEMCNYEGTMKPKSDAFDVYEKMQAEITRLQAELATANETIRRNERSAAYNYEMYNKLRIELRDAREWAAAWKKLCKLYYRAGKSNVNNSAVNSFTGFMRWARNMRHAMAGMVTK